MENLRLGVSQLKKLGWTPSLAPQSLVAHSKQSRHPVHGEGSLSTKDGNQTWAEMGCSHMLEGSGNNKYVSKPEIRQEARPGSSSSQRNFQFLISPSQIVQSRLRSYEDDEGVTFVFSRLGNERAGNFLPGIVPCDQICDLLWRAGPLQRKVFR